MSHPSHRDGPARPDERRRLTRRNWLLATVGVASGSGALMLACGGGGGGGGGSPVSAGGSASGPDAGAGVAPGTPSGPAPAPPAPASASSAPALGSHGLVFDRMGESRPSLSVSGLSMRANASTLLACVGRGQLSADAAPTDSAGNVYAQLGTAHAYTLWPNSGTTLYACAQARGMDGASVTVPKPNQGDEVTLSVVEVANGGLVRDVQWTEVLAGQALTSATVTTTGPALLVAWWWGDADVEGDKTAVPDNGFTVVDSVMAAGALVQCAVAVRQVEAAGSYNVTWTSTPRQGAQLWIAAVQAAAS